MGKAFAYLVLILVALFALEWFGIIINNLGYQMNDIVS